ncbi:hypothetical protein FRC01_009689 [Tulasnella sp. 417]|nr:hypothetical protein FRC01_009689 [Tulasnella sp. 417]
MKPFYGVKNGRVPGVYRSWADASEQVMHFPGAVHAAFTNLRAAVEFSGIPLHQQPDWVQVALGVPSPGPANPISAAGPPPSVLPSSTSASPPRLHNNPHSPRLPEPDISLAEALRAISIHNPAAPAPPLAVENAASLNAVSPRRPAATCNEINRNRSDQGPPALPNVFTRAGGDCSPLTSRTMPRHSTPVNSPSTSPIRSPGQNLDLNCAQVTAQQNHLGWLEDSILSGVFHPPSSDVDRSGENAHNDTSASDSDSSDEVWLDPMEPIPGGLHGAQDLLPQRYQITLRTAPRDATHYPPVLTSLLGQHAVNYMFLHYFSAGSTVVVAQAYMDHETNARAFVEHLVGVGMPPRQAAYLWTIIAPETADYPQSQFSYFRWAAAMRAIAARGGSDLRGVRREGQGSVDEARGTCGSGQSAVSTENDDGVSNDDDDTEADDDGVTSTEVEGGNVGYDTSGPVHQGGSDDMDIDDEIEYVDFPEEDTN